MFLRYHPYKYFFSNKQLSQFELGVFLYSIYTRGFMFLMPVKPL